MKRTVRWLISVFFIMAIHGCSKEATGQYPVIDKTITEMNFEQSLISLNEIQQVSENTLHSAFTDIIEHNKIYYLCYRSSNTHQLSINNKIIVLSSDDFKNWTKIEEFEIDNMDLRDPKFLVNENNQLIIYAGGIKFQKDLVTSYHLVKQTLNKEQNIEKKVSNDLKFWPWRITEDLHNNFYTWGYNADGTYFQLLKYKNQFDFIPVCSNISIINKPSEATVRFQKNNIYSLIRRAGSTLFGVADIKDICNISWTALPILEIGGPNFLFYKENKVIIAGRIYRNGEKIMSILLFDIKENRLTTMIEFASGVDSGYPGMIIEDNTLLVSYHATVNAITSVYTASLSLNF